MIVLDILQICKIDERLYRADILLMKYNESSKEKTYLTRVGRFSYLTKAIVRLFIKLEITTMKNAYNMRTLIVQQSYNVVRHSMIYVHFRQIDKRVFTYKCTCTMPKISIYDNTLLRTVARSFVYSIVNLL